MSQLFQPCEVCGPARGHLLALLNSLDLKDAVALHARPVHHKEGDKTFQIEYDSIFISCEHCRGTGSFLTADGHRLLKLLEFHLSLPIEEPAEF